MEGIPSTHKPPSPVARPVGLALHARVGARRPLREGRVGVCAGGLSAPAEPCVLFCPPATERPGRGAPLGAGSAVLSGREGQVSLRNPRIAPGCSEETWPGPW